MTNGDEQPGTSDKGRRCSAPELHGHDSRGRIRSRDHPRFRRSNPGLHHRPTNLFAQLLSRRHSAGEPSNRVEADLLRDLAFRGYAPAAEKSAPRQGSATLLARLARSISALHHRRMSRLRTHVRVRTTWAFASLATCSFFASEGARATSLNFYGQGTGGHGRACALRFRTSQLVQGTSCLPEKYPWPITTGPE